MNRYVKAVKIALNKRFNNKSTENVDIASVITSFSHKSYLGHGDVLISKDLIFFIITKIFSEHFVQGYFTPAEYEFTLDGIVYYHPKYRKWPYYAYKKKRIFKPFSDKPFIKIRQRKFYLRFKRKDEPIPNYRCQIGRFAYPAEVW